MTNEDFEQVYYPRYKLRIAAIARRFARRDDALYDDLFQCGCIKLWTLDLSRATTNIDSYVSKALARGMVDYLRQLDPRQYTSLEEVLSAGGQLVEDDFGEPTIIEPTEAGRVRRPHSLTADFTGVPDEG